MNPYDPNQQQQQNWNNPGQNPPYNQPNPNWQQQQQQQPPYQQGYNQQTYQPYIPPYNPHVHASNLDLPNATNAQICGIVGLIMFWNVIGIALNIAALIMGSNAMTEYERSPGTYQQAAYNKAKTGKVCGIIGLGLLGLFVVILVIAIAAS